MHLSDLQRAILVFLSVIYI